MLLKLFISEKLRGSGVESRLNLSFLDKLRGSGAETQLNLWILSLFALTNWYQKYSSASCSRISFVSTIFIKVALNGLNSSFSSTDLTF